MQDLQVFVQIGEQLKMPNQDYQKPIPQYKPEELTPERRKELVDAFCGPDSFRAVIDVSNPKILKYLQRLSESREQARRKNIRFGSNLASALA